MDNKYIGMGAAVILLMGAAAAVASYTTRESLQPQTVADTSQPPQPPHRRQPERVMAAQPVQPQKPRCDDRNIVGTVAGGAGGGLVGSQIGKGNGNTAAIIGGVVGGALLGNEYIPTRNVICSN